MSASAKGDYLAHLIFLGDALGHWSAVPLEVNKVLGRRPWNDY